MKTFLSIVAGIIAITMSSCYANKPIAQQKPDNNETYRVDYLFEHDGCKVYRFQDRGEYIYFTNCTGDVTSLSSDSTRERTIVKSSIPRRPR
ncbi:hypothetical protein M2451_000735 [Dysgonomonas sp. PFB1-18]|uniref:DUF4884 domain-containing protein n=1 Tax=unclassified Dysgonomonas TaxID=2630389 RepID=UPI0024772857|nr:MULTISPECIES: DUF4884 domain-containing protein [unclassified Dysgonomonas]MDL2303679.1 DUF4884 domain-containing protein [Dysgonomonas sp. OttesenSCG-928-D17]MDH6308424.1 hypothetical protein [Dysgonomonas sp. PF1-14]MDH6337925.1 hypothetical protein [Dysgonomonas sp. PF1-16]MDH6379422.1 hypothetical protein [Dysgonomonas sp. PFB1-18]MDH6396753.1 hypothetical protein [Dysgonomonas sp. PF1-23]